MSKQLKYKLKKTLKNAEFVHADLEYHEELSRDALKGFQEEIARLISILSEEDKQRLQRGFDEEDDELEERTEQLEAPVDESDCTDVVPSDIPPEEPETTKPENKKSIALKKLFRQIAEQTHPDKARANGFSNKEVKRLGELFKRARSAYDNGNWYVLYSIAIDLDLPIDDPTNEQIDWIVEDIKKTLTKIARISDLTAWHWYTGDDEAKKNTLRFYFQQAYGFEHPNL
jgi:hypothetical protein